VNRKHYYNLRRAYRVLANEGEDTRGRRWEREAELSKVVGGTLLGYPYLAVSLSSTWGNPAYYQLEGYNILHAPLEGDKLKDLIAARRDYRWKQIRFQMKCNLRADR
jgi:hypothetical protein